MLESIGAVVWGPFLLIPLLLLTGLYLTILLRGLQFKRLGYALWFGLIKRSEPGAEGDVSHYQALTTALAATIGVGNIAGVATAIYLGGPGASYGCGSPASSAWRRSIPIGRRAVAPYRLVFVLAIFVGAITELEVVWNFADIMNGLMALPNLVGLLFLSGLIARETRAFFAYPDWK